MDAGGADLSADIALPFAVGLVAAALGVPADDVSWFAARWWAMHRGVVDRPGGASRLAGGRWTS